MPMLAAKQVTLAHKAPPSPQNCQGAPPSLHPDPPAGQSSENHHLTDQECNSSQSRKRTHSYSKEESDHRPVNDGSVVAPISAPGASKCKTKKDVPPKNKHLAKCFA